jgi:hypothetical protein
MADISTEQPESINMTMTFHKTLQAGFAIILLGLVISSRASADEATVETPGTLTGDNWKFDREQIEQLPNGNHAASVLEFYFLPAVLSNPDTAGFSRGENVQISMFGESYKWQRWYFAGANISNPSKWGEPMVYIPLSVTANIDAQKYAVSNIAKNGIHLQPLLATAAHDSVQFSAPFEIAGPAFIPRRTADREPASDWGAPTSARGYAAGSFEGQALKVIGEGDKATGYLLADGFFARRNFNNLSSPETTGSGTLMATLAPGWLPADSLHATLQARSRSNLGSEYYFAQGQTLKSDQIAGVFNYEFSSEKAAGALAMGYAYSNRALNSDRMQRSMVDSLIQAPAISPETTQTFFIDASGFRKRPNDAYDLEYGVNSRFEFEHRYQQMPENRIDETLYGTASYTTQYDGAANEDNYLLRWQPFIRAVKQRARSEFTASANAHIDWGFTDAGSKLGTVLPAATLSGKTFLGASSFFVGGGLIHDTMGFSLAEVSFLNKDSLSGSRYSWNDANGNGVPDSGETNNGIRTGGKYHGSASGLQAPQKEELNVSFGYTGWKNWLLKFNINGRMYRKLLEVRYADGTSPTFTSSTAGATVATYDRTNAGNEIYELRNAENDAYYAHFEITVAQIPNTSPWIFRAGIGAYYGAGYTPQGLGAFYNDAGVYNESTADPNFRETRFGRLDNDRGYIGKIFFGRRFFKVLSVTNVIRYRDGEATAGSRVVTGMAQGPIIVPYEERGGGLTGIGRYTYSLAWDLRIRYESVLAGNRIWAFIDVYNLMNSRTELFEYPLEGKAYRDPVEQGIARSMRLGLGMNF